MGTAFHVAGVNEDVRALDAPPGGVMGQCAQPPVLRAAVLQRLRCVAESRVERGANVVEQDVVPPGQPADRLEVRLRRLFLAKVADHHAAQVLRRLDQWPARRRRLKTNDRLGAVLCGQVFDGAFVQHHQPVRQHERPLRLSIDVNIAVQVCAGQHDSQRMPGLAGCPALDRVR